MTVCIGAGLCLAALAAAPLSQAAPQCEAIRFERGATSATIKGVAPADDVICYEMETAEGQTATLKVLSGPNTIFTIEDIADAQDSYQFRTEARTYRILVGQLMRAAGGEAFALRISVR
jgi:hypothetical protein